MNISTRLPPKLLVCRCSAAPPKAPRLAISPYNGRGSSSPQARSGHSRSPKKSPRSPQFRSRSAERNLHVLCHSWRNRMAYGRRSLCCFLLRADREGEEVVLGNHVGRGGHFLVGSAAHHRQPHSAAGFPCFLRRNRGQRAAEDLPLWVHVGCGQRELRPYHALSGDVTRHGHGPRIHRRLRNSDASHLPRRILDHRP